MTFFTTGVMKSIAVRMAQHQSGAPAAMAIRISGMGSLGRLGDAADGLRGERYGSVGVMVASGLYGHQAIGVVDAGDHPYGRSWSWADVPGHD